MKVSVVLPSLNVVEYIEECIESVINQTLREIEIICVDAGSTDGTLEKIKSCMRKDKRIKLINSEKKSYGYQMNIGIDEAKGEYIAIVETDDYIPDNMLSDLYDVASLNKVDFVKADFYRFTGEKDTLHKILFRLSEDKKYYNRIIDISTNKECFSFEMNTWSGIYNRTFLVNNNIRHHESLGASYQDNGFWFQTFMYAKRAFFVDKPYYMNRRDNDKSSVYNRIKNNCIQDEYMFIFNIIKKNPELLDKFGKIFALYCCKTYLGFYHMIEDSFKEEYLCRCSEDFNCLINANLLDKDTFKETEWKTINSIINDSKKYYKETEISRMQFWENINNQERIIIYGAGLIGRELLDLLDGKGMKQKVECFAVTTLQDNLTKYRGIEIREISSLMEYRETVCIVIAVTSEKNLSEITKSLKSLGFRNVIIF